MMYFEGVRIRLCRTSHYHRLPHSTLGQNQTYQSVPSQMSAGRNSSHLLHNVKQSISISTFSSSFPRPHHEECRVSVLLDDGQGWERRVEAERIVKRDSNEPDFQFLVPNYHRNCDGAREISVQFETRLSQDQTVLSDPLSILFYFDRHQKRKMSRSIDYREYSTEDDDDSNVENRDVNVGYKRRKSFSKRRQSKKSRTSGQQSGSCSKESQGLDVLELSGDKTVTMLDVFNMIRYLGLDLSELTPAWCRQSYVEEDFEDFESIIASMYSFDDDDIAEMLYCSSISDTEQRAKRMGTILSENQMERIIADLLSGKSKFDELNLPSGSSIQNGSLSQQEQDQLFLIEDTFKSMALDLPFTAQLDMDLEITHQL